MQTGTETCENCGRAIGKLETPELHEGHVVCAACKATLTMASHAASDVDYETELAKEADRFAGNDVARRMRMHAPRPSPPSKRDDAGTHQKIGAVIAIIGTIVGVVGYRLYDPLMPMDGLTALTFGGGILAALIGMLWFAAGRFMSR